ncbi:MAG TPA: SDR family NAD(P)-dependent oxidoreductase [Gemmatimonadaceae bacterium]|nr:SDR family NAD(P)-dependent oxidoreductase [Gemmatimonadaceae bacterium]
MGYALSGKTALVTGANRGIGEAIVDALVAAGVNKVYAAAATSRRSTRWWNAMAHASCRCGSM